jgi:phospholipase C
MPSMLDIKHILLMMMENRSFDHYLGALTLEGRSDVDGISDPSTIRNPSGEGPNIPMSRLEGPSGPIEINDKPFRDPPHEYEEVLTQVNGGAMDGFVKAYEKKHKRHKSDPADRARHVMGYYTRQTLPVLYALADEFVVCDRWFSSFAGSTWPNRVYALAGDADQLIGTGFKWLPRWNAYRYPDPPFVSEWGTEMARSWRAYSARPEQDSVFALWRIGPVYRGGRGKSLENFAADCQSGKLPRLGIIEPDYAISDDHPPHNPLRGQQVISTVVKALLSSPSWYQTLLVITYDEHGGFYDHVPPPPGPEGRQPPHDRLGVRVPTIVLSPYTPQRGVARQPFDHTSWLKTVAERWGYRVPGKRASSMEINSLWNTDCFDWSLAPRSGQEILSRIPEPGFHLASRDIDIAASSKPTDLESNLRALNVMREMERLR